jgi:hypothetical protein
MLGVKTSQREKKEKYFEYSFISFLRIIFRGSEISRNFILSRYQEDFAGTQRESEKKQDIKT